MVAGSTSARPETVLKLTFRRIRSVFPPRLREHSPPNSFWRISLLFSISSEGVWDNPIERGVFESTAWSVYVSYDFDGTKETYCCGLSRAAIAGEEIDAFMSSVSSDPDFVFRQQTGCFVHTKAQTEKKNPDTQILLLKNVWTRVTNSSGPISKRNFMCWSFFYHLSEIRLNISFKWSYCPLP